MALDYGSARTGVAVSDPTGTLARPLGVVERAGTDARTRRARAARRASEDAERIVVGLPLTLRGDARRAGGRDRALRRGAARRRRRPRRALRRALHDRPRAADRGSAPEDARRRRASPFRAISSGPRRARSDLAVVAARRRLRLSGAAAADDDDPPAAAVPGRLPRGLHARADGRARAERWRRSPSTRAHHKVEALGGDVPRRRRRPRVIPGFGAKKLPLEGFLFPDTYDFDRKSTSTDLVGDAARGRSSTNWGTRSNLSYARSKNLTPYDVLKIASMIEGEARRAERATARRRRDLQPAARARCRSGSTRRSATGCTSRRRSRSRSPSSRATTRTTRGKYPGLPPTPINNPGLASIEAAAHPAHVDYLYFVRKPDTAHHYFTANYQDFLRPRGPVRLLSRDRRLLGHPVAHSLSPRMQNAAFAARRARRGRTSRATSRPRSSRPRCARSSYANVTAPYKRDVARLARLRARRRSTRIVRGRGFSTDAAILEHVTDLSQAGDRGGRGCGGGVSARAAGGARLLARAASGRPTCATPTS